LFVHALAEVGLDAQPLRKRIGLRNQVVRLALAGRDRRRPMKPGEAAEADEAHDEKQCKRATDQAAPSEAPLVSVDVATGRDLACLVRGSNDGAEVRVATRVEAGILADPSEITEQLGPQLLHRLEALARLLGHGPQHDAIGLRWD